MDKLRQIAESFGCQIELHDNLSHGGRLIGRVDRQGGIRAVRPDGGATTFHRNLEGAVLALLITHYTPARGQ